MRVFAFLAALCVVAAGVTPAAANPIPARDAIVEIFERFECFLTDGELKAEVAKAGVSRADMKSALILLRADGSLGSGRVNGVAVLMLRGTPACKGASFRTPPSRLLTRPSDGTEAAAVDAIVAFMESNDCVATDAEIRRAVRDAGASDNARIEALRVLKGRLVTIRDGSFPGLRLTGTEVCP